MARYREACVLLPSPASVAGRSPARRGAPHGGGRAVAWRHKRQRRTRAERLSQWTTRSSAPGGFRHSSLAREARAVPPYDSSYESRRASPAASFSAHPLTAPMVPNGANLPDQRRRHVCPPTQESEDEEVDHCATQYRSDERTEGGRACHRQLPGGQYSGRSSSRTSRPIIRRTMIRRVADSGEGTRGPHMYERWTRGTGPRSEGVALVVPEHPAHRLFVDPALAQPGGDGTMSLQDRQQGLTVGLRSAR